MAYRLSKGKKKPPEVGEDSVDSIPGKKKETPCYSVKCSHNLQQLTGLLISQSLE